MLEAIWWRDGAGQLLCLILSSFLSFFNSLFDRNFIIWVLWIKGCENIWQGITIVFLLKICLLLQCWNVSHSTRFPRPESIKCCHSYSRLCWPCCTCVALCSSQTISLHEKQLGSVFVREASFYLFINLNDSVVSRGLGHNQALTMMWLVCSNWSAGCS